MYVADIVHVGGNGKPFVTIAALNESARISLIHGGEDASSAEMGVMEGYANMRLTQGDEDAPSLWLRVQKDVGAGIEGMSHVKRSEAHFEIFTVKRDGAFRSVCLLRIRVEQMV